jgi:hypothetical protein
MKKYILELLQRMREDWDYAALILLFISIVISAIYVYSDYGLTAADKILLERIDQTLEGL